MNRIFRSVTSVLLLALSLMFNINHASASEAIFYRSEKIDGLNVFYREAGSRNNPTVLLLHGFPTSSFMFRNLIPKLAEKYHVIAPDYPGFGKSSRPSVEEYRYSFENIALVVQSLVEKKKIKKYSLYLMDYGAPIGFRIAVKNPKKVQALIIQNGNAYEEGLKEFWDPIKAYWADKTEANAQPLKGFISLDGLKWQYTHGVKNVEKINPDNWILDSAHLSSAQDEKIQLELFYDYRTNIPLYPSWQSYFRKYQPPTLIVWGKNDYIFPEDGAHPYKRDLKNLDFYLLDTGHFALEEQGDFIQQKILSFLGKNLK